MDLSFDHLTRFLLHRAGVRGVVVSLDEAWTQIQSREAYPLGVAALLGEAVAAAALLTGHIKVEGRLSIQLKGEAPIRTLFAECTARHRVRGIAMWEGALDQALGPRALGEGALLAITIEKPSARNNEPVRYQGLVALDQDSLSAAFEAYFLQSEQLPTCILLAANAQRARGLMLQVLPGEAADADCWTRAQALFATLGSSELLNTEIDLLLYRLFHEEQPELLSSHPLAFGCSCSRERVGSMLLALGEDEARAALASEGTAVAVQCEFCGQRYRFDAVDLDQLFGGGGSSPVSESLN